MKVLLTGGAGFIGRWTAKLLLEKGEEVVVIDDLSNGAMKNIEEFMNHPCFTFFNGDIKDEEFLNKLFEKHEFDRIYHLAASIVVQDSIDNPRKTFENDVVGTFLLLEKAKEQMFGKKSKMDGDRWIFSQEKRRETRFVFMSTCMVYAPSLESGISEEHKTDPVSPYGASKIAAENLVLSYQKTYGLPTVVIRPFNTYGPFQKSNGEGGVVPIFVKRVLEGKPILIYGTGEQTRDLLYVEDCAEFIVKSSEEAGLFGQIVNAGTGRDVTINELAEIISQGIVRIEHVPHIHPQSEIAKLKCDPHKAKERLNWEPKTSLEVGVSKLREWMNDEIQ